MKLGLTLLPIVAMLTVTQVANAQAHDADFFVSSDDDISEAIYNLSHQPQSQEDNLAALVDKLNTYPENQNAITFSNNNNNTSGALLALRPITSKARMTSGFGYRYIFGKTQFHKGMDFAAPVGTPIYATGDGVVTISGWGKGYGRYIEIDHGNGLTTRYAHNSRNRVSVGDTVVANQHIADVGNTGRSTGPHLHYEVRKNGQAVNPQTYLALAPER